MPINSYRDLRVWQESVALVTSVYELTQRFPKEERYGLTAQVRRATVSISANISEGHGRSTRGEYLNQLSVARGSINEVETLLTVSCNLGFVTESRVEPLETKLIAIRRMLVALQQALRKRRVTAT